MLIKHSEKLHYSFKKYEPEALLLFKILLKLIAIYNEHQIEA